MKKQVPYDFVIASFKDIRSRRSYYFYQRNWQIATLKIVFYTTTVPLPAGYKRTENEI